MTAGEIDRNAMDARDGGSVATEFTLEFCRSEFPEPARLLEVGCGRGELSAALASVGHTVIALDPSASSVDAARSRGVDARLSRWPTALVGEEFGRFDGVIFARSLHHMEDLEGSVAQALHLLEPGGRLLVEDFAFDEASTAARRWLVRVMRVLEESSLLEPSPGSFAAALVDSGFDLATWTAEHLPGHRHSAPLGASVMEKVLQRHCPDLRAERCPYLFRYLLDAVAVPRQEEVLRSVLELERLAVDQDRGFAVGRRWVGRIGS